MKRAKLFVQKRFITKQCCIAVCLIVLLFQNSFAAEDTALEIKPSILWLSDKVNLGVFGDNEYDSFLGSSELWANKWGVSAKLFNNDSNDVFGLAENSEYFNIDVKRRFGQKEKTNVELGLGWQEFSIESQLDASGPRVSLAGQLNVLKSFKVYGATSYFPELDDNLSDNTATAYEVEAGLLYSPLPSLSLKAGYRLFNLDLDDPLVDDLGSSAGFLLGSDLSW